MEITDVALLKISPFWLIIVSALTGLIVKFWDSIKSTVELKLKGKQSIEEKKVEHELQSISEDKKLDKAKRDTEIERLVARIKELEEKIELQTEHAKIQDAKIYKLTKANTYFASA